jgi:hypothetical protein
MSYARGDLCVLEEFVDLVVGQGFAEGGEDVAELALADVSPLSLSLASYLPKLTKHPPQTTLSRASKCLTRKGLRMLTNVS